MNAIKRGLRGALLGAAVAAAIAVTLVVLISGCQAVTSDPSDPFEGKGRHGLSILFPIALAAGLTTGLIGGFAARLPRKGLPMLTSLGIVAACAMMCRLLSPIDSPFNGPCKPSIVSEYAPAILAALAGGIGVLSYGIIATMRAPTNAETVDAEEVDRVSACSANTPPRPEASMRE
ncbi:MAG TPA: hypothetical protein DD670_13015 [Planctomycetaceae bacterium]|nr:hypothetical protein [Planctomycetaceae bacterium]